MKLTFIYIFILVQVVLANMCSDVCVEKYPYSNIKYSYMQGELCTCVSDKHTFEGANRDLYFSHTSRFKDGTSTLGPKCGQMTTVEINKIIRKQFIKCSNINIVKRYNVNGNVVSTYWDDDLLDSTIYHNNGKKSHYYSSNGERGHWNRLILLSEFDIDGIDITPLAQWYNNQHVTYFDIKLPNNTNSYDTLYHIEKYDIHGKITEIKERICKEFNSEVPYSDKWYSALDKCNDHVTVNYRTKVSSKLFSKCGFAHIDIHGRSKRPEKCNSTSNWTIRK